MALRYRHDYYMLPQSISDIVDGRDFHYCSNDDRTESEQLDDIIARGKIKPVRTGKLYDGGIPYLTNWLKEKDKYPPDPIIAAALLDMLFDLSFENNRLDTIEQQEKAYQDQLTAWKILATAAYHARVGYDKAIDTGLDIEVPMEIPAEPIKPKPIELYHRTTGLFFASNPGTGKSFALKIYKSWSQENTRLVEAFDLVQQFNRLTIKEHNDFYGQLSFGDLIIDELGYEDPISRYDKDDYELLDKVITIRYNAWQQFGFLTSFSTNLSRAQLDERYDQRAISRIYQMCEMVAFEGKDLRKEAAL